MKKRRIGKSPVRTRHSSRRRTRGSSRRRGRSSVVADESETINVQDLHPAFKELVTYWLDPARGGIPKKWKWTHLKVLNWEYDTTSKIYNYLYKCPNDDENRLNGTIGYDSFKEFSPAWPKGV